MQEQHLVVTNRLGLHARAAAKLVRTASGFRSSIRLERAGNGGGDDISADAKSILSVLMLAASRGTHLSIVCEGIDEEVALGAVCALFERNFGEDQE